MIKFYSERTREEQASRLPQRYRANYKATVLDQVEIDGNIIRGYMEYSFLNEKSYIEQPVRSNNGSIENINSYATFLTPRLIIKYSMMNIEDYRKLMLLIQSKNEFLVTCYDPVINSRVTHRMYFAPTQMPIIYQQYLKALGVQEFSIELIGTNNNIKEHTITYDYNIPTPYDRSFPQGSSTQTFYDNVSGIVGEYATYIDGEKTYLLSDPHTSEILGNEYTFLSWNTKKDGTGFTYLDGDAYYIRYSAKLYAQWRK